MRIGLSLPQTGVFACREGVVSIARHAESCGLDSLWVSDHVVHPSGATSGYPYSGTGRIPFDEDDGYLEAVTTLGVVAGATERISIGISVLVLPMRETLIAAKALATLDVLSNGRTAVAVGAGWWREEFDALGVEFDHRGAVLDEQLHALTQLWQRGRGRMQGRHVRYPEVTVRPLPVQPGGPQVWIAGRGQRTWRRIAETNARGWHGIGHRPEMIASAQEGLRRACEAADRDISTVALSTTTGLPPDPQRAARRILDLAHAGVSQIVFIPFGTTVDDVRRNVDALALDALPLVSAETETP